MSGHVLGKLLVATFLVASAGIQSAAADSTDLAAKAKANIAETRKYTTLLNEQMRGWNSDLERDRARATGYVTEWSDKAAQEADAGKKADSGKKAVAVKYRDGFASHVRTLEVIQKASADLGKLGEALEADQTLLDSLERLIETGSTQGYLESLRSATSALHTQEFRTQAVLQLIGRLDDILKGTDSQLRTLLAGLDPSDSAVQWRRELLENDLQLNSVQAKHLKVGAKLADLVHTLLLKSGETLKIQADLADARGR